MSGSIPDCGVQVLDAHASPSRRSPAGRTARCGLLLAIFVLGVVACDRTPPVVYVPTSEPQVEVDVRASATSVAVGETVVLRAERRTRGGWERIRCDKLDKGDCWMRRPPPAREDEVADNLRWRVRPSEGVCFNVSPRADHAREVVFRRPGMFVLEATSSIWCGAGKEARARPIRVVVGAGTKAGTKRPEFKHSYPLDQGVRVVRMGVRTRVVARSVMRGVSG